MPTCQTKTTGDFVQNTRLKWNSGELGNCKGKEINLNRDFITVSLNDGSGDDDDWCPTNFEAIFESGSGTSIFRHDFGGAHENNFGPSKVKRKSEFYCDIS